MIAFTLGALIGITLAVIVMAALQLSSRHSRLEEEREAK